MSQGFFDALAEEFEGFHGVSSSKETWTREIPREPGWYWFFGWRHKKPEDLNPKLSMVRVKRAGKGDSQFLIYITDGAFWYPEREMRSGWFQNIVRPSLTINETSESTT